MKIKKSWLFFLLGGAFFLFLMGSWVNAQAQVNLRIAHYIDEKHPIHLGAKQMAAKVEERTKGQVKITIYPANTLGSPPEVVKQVKLGTLDINRSIK